MDLSQPDPMVSSTSDQKLSENASLVSGGFLKTAKHPKICFFHMLFKVLSAFTGFFSLNYITTFVLTVIFVAFDFWTTKNITGRLLVGLRWWNDVKADGTSEWMYESADVQVNDTDRSVFWWSLAVYPVFWLSCLFINILHVEWVLLLVAAVTLSGSNLYGYWMCHRKRSGNSSSVTQWAKEAALKAVVNNVVNQQMNTTSANSIGKSAAII